MYAYIYIYPPLNQQIAPGNLLGRLSFWVPGLIFQDFFYLLFVSRTGTLLAVQEEVYKAWPDDLKVDDPSRNGQVIEPIFFFEVHKNPHLYPPPLPETNRIDSSLQQVSGLYCNVLTSQLGLWTLYCSSTSLSK